MKSIHSEYYANNKMQYIITLSPLSHSSKNVKTKILISIYMQVCIYTHIQIYAILSPPPFQLH